MKLTMQDIAKRDFLTFLAKVFREDHAEPLELAPYIQYVAAELDWLEKGKGGRLCIKMPPRHLKTEMATAFMAYLLGHEPHLRIMVLSFSESQQSSLRARCAESSKVPGIGRRSRPGSSLIGARLPTSRRSGEEGYSQLTSVVGLQVAAPI